MVYARVLIASWLLFFSSLAFAQPALTGAGGSAVTAAATYTGPGDIVSGALFFYGGKAYSAALAAANTPLYNAARVADGHTCDILAATGGGAGNTANCSNSGDNGEAATTFCTTTCHAAEIYDQIGTGCGGSNCNISIASDGERPIITFSGTNMYLVCAGACDGTTTNAISITQPFTLSSVINNSSEGVQSNWWGCSPLQYGVQNIGANTWFIFAGGAVPSASATDGSFHAIQGVYNNASSDIYIDGSANASNLSSNTGCTTTGMQLFEFGGTQQVQGSLGQLGVWLVAFTTGQKSSMNSNEHSNWGF
jgi:hypothetical protein